MKWHIFAERDFRCADKFIAEKVFGVCVSCFFFLIWFFLRQNEKVFVHRKLTNQIQLKTCWKFALCPSL